MRSSALRNRCGAALSRRWIGLVLSAGFGTSCAGMRSEDASASLARGWELIERSASRTARGTEAQVEELLAASRELPAEQIVAFDEFLTEQLDRAYRWDLWAVAYLAMGGCSDDSFLYFRAWLIAQGKECFEAALSDPAVAALAIQPGDRPQLESLIYVASKAHEDVAGRALPRSSARPIRREPAGAAWEESEVHLLYPELAKRFGRS